MDGVRIVCLEGGTVGEPHYAAECVALGSWGEVHTNVGFEQTGNLSSQRKDFGLDATLLLVGDVGFPAESEGVNDHGAIMAKVERR